MTAGYDNIPTSFIIVSQRLDQSRSETKIWTLSVRSFVCLSVSCLTARIFSRMWQPCLCTCQRNIGIHLVGIRRGVFSKRMHFFYWANVRKIIELPFCLEGLLLLNHAMWILISFPCTSWALIFLCVYSFSRIHVFLLLRTLIKQTSTMAFKF